MELFRSVIIQSIFKELSPISHDICKINISILDSSKECVNHCPTKNRKKGDLQWGTGFHRLEACAGT